MIFKLCNNGKSVVGTREDGVTVSYSIEAEEYKQWLSEGGVPEPEFTDIEILDNAIIRFESIVDAFIQGKIEAYNVTNGVKFRDIDAFTKYAMNTASTHNVIANKFIVYADKVWKAVRDYQALATTIPTDVEFQAVLDSVVF